MFPATAKDHRAISLERLISTKKPRLTCIKETYKESNSFSIKEAHDTILYQLHICKHKTTGISLFESHFGRRSNTPLINNCLIPKYSDLSYNKILNHYSDEETVIRKELLPD